MMLSHNKTLREIIHRSVFLLNSKIAYCLFVWILRKIIEAAYNYLRAHTLKMPLLYKRYSVRTSYFFSIEYTIEEVCKECIKIPPLHIDIIHQQVVAVGKMPGRDIVPENM